MRTLSTPVNEVVAAGQQAKLSVSGRLELPWLMHPCAVPSFRFQLADRVWMTSKRCLIKAEEPIDSLVRKSERAGILVILLDFDIRLHDRLDAFSCWVGDYTERPIVVLRSRASWDRLRWSMAHELGHAVLHRRQREGDIEAAANEFANELLLPRRVLIREWPRNPTLLSLLPLKENWGLSLQALMEHGFRAGLIDESRRMSLYKQLSNRKWPDSVRWREREPGYNLRDTELPRMLGKMVEVGFGVDSGLDVVSDATGYWPVLLLQQLLGVQLMRSADSSRRHPVSSPEGKTRVRLAPRG